MASLIELLLLLVTLWTARWLWVLLSARRILHNIPGPPSPSFLTGNFLEIYDLNAWDFHHGLAEKYGGVFRFDGLLGEKQLYVFDPKSLYQILVKDQDIFEEADSSLYGSLVLFGEGILATSGEQHKKQRKMLNPAFSAAHLRQMVPIFFDVGKRLQSAIQSRVQDGPKEIDILLWMTRTALELIGQAGLGHSFDSLDTDEIPPYITSVKQLQVTVHKMALGMKYILPWVTKLGTPNFRRLIVNIFPWQTLHEGRDIADTLYATAVRIYHLKKTALVDEGDSSPIGGQGKDIASILLKANSNASSNERLSEDEIIGQLNTLIFAATDTTSSALSRTLHILAQHPDAQEKLRREIRFAQQSPVDISYDQLNSMEYLDAICRETLRLYPPASFIRRMTQKDVVLTTSTPITTLDGSTATEIPVPARTEVIVSILASNRNPAIWGSDALEWKPERWLSPLPKSVTEAHLPGIYSHLMTFAAGGRSCIGSKFSQLEMKVVLCLLIERFNFSLSKSDEDIAWQMSALAVPSVDGREQLPLKVELAK